MAARGVALLALALLLFDPGLRRSTSRSRPLVLLDNSVSMHAAGGSADSARALAPALGDVVPFGELIPGEPGGQSSLAAPLAAATAGGRPLIVITDGEVPDAATLPPDLLAHAEIRALPRATAPGIALLDVRGPQRLITGDTLEIQVELSRVGAAGDSAVIEVRDGEQVVLRGTARFAPNTARSRLVLSGRLPAGVSGERWLRVLRVGAPDGEPDDDERWHRLTISATPGIVFLAAHPDWDARFLYTTLGEVTDAPVRGYVQLVPGQWRRMDNLAPVPAAEVMAAARNAVLLAVRGDTVPYRSLGRARLLWPPITRAGDWYVSPAGVSPLSNAFVGVSPESLPPVSAAAAVSVANPGWTGAMAQLSRRGAEVPVIAGDERDGRRIVLGIEGLYRWSFGGGAAEQVWRAMIADAVSWLLVVRDRDGTVARPVASVVERGRPVVFRWTGAGAPTPTPITFALDSVERSDTLRFGTDGVASVALPVGKHHFTLAGGGSGDVMVERFSQELVPSPVTLETRGATATPAPSRRSLRDMLPIFAIAVAGFALEWMLRRRLGLR